MLTLLLALERPGGALPGIGLGGSVTPAPLVAAAALHLDLLLVADSE